MAQFHVNARHAHTHAAQQRGVGEGGVARQCRHHRHGHVLPRPIRRSGNLGVQRYIEYS